MSIEVDLFDWHAIVVLPVLTALIPGMVLRQIVRIYPKGHPRRDELIAELYVRPYIERLLFIAQSLEMSVTEGLPARWRARRIDGTADEPGKAAPSEAAIPISIGATAKRSGMSVSALRFYEDKGLIDSTRTVSGQRVYRPDMLDRLAFIRVAQRVGLTLEMIGQALAMLPAGTEPSPTDWQRLNTYLRPALDERVRLLEGLRNAPGGCLASLPSRQSPSHPA